MFAVTVAFLDCIQLLSCDILYPCAFQEFPKLLIKINGSNIYYRPHMETLSLLMFRIVVGGRLFERHMSS